MKPARVDLTIVQGSTFRFKFYWYSDIEVVKVISGLVRSYPAVLTAIGHGLPASAVPATILDVGDWIDSPTLAVADRQYVTKLDVDTFSVKLDATAAPAYSGSAGRLVYNAPIDLSAWSARMQIRESVDATAILQSFSTEDGHIALGVDGVIALTLTDAVTDLLDFSAAVYDLELKDPATADVTRVAGGKVTLLKQVTR